MAAPRVALAVLVMMLTVIALTEGMRGSGPRKCCSTFNKRQVHKDKVVSYTKTSQRCNIPGVFLRMVNGKTLCVKRSAPWVNELMRQLDAKAARVGETSNL